MALAFDLRGALWVGTQDGAAWYDGRAWNVVDMPERSISNYVEAVLPASDGSFWFGRQDGGVARLAEGAWRCFARKEGLPADRVTSLAETHSAAGESIIWAATHGGGLARYSQGRWEVLDRKRGLPSDRLWRIISRNASEATGEIWVCGEEGCLARVDAQGRIHAIPGLPPVSVNSILETVNEEGRPELWVSTFGAGLGHFSEGKWSFTTVKEGFPSNFATDVTETRSLEGKRVIWVSTVAGLVRMEGGKRQNFTVRWGLPTDTVYRLRRDPYRADGLWIGTSGGGLLYFQEGSWLTHDAPSGLPGNYVTALAQGRGPQGEFSIFAGTSLGLARFDGKLWRRIPMPASFEATRVTALLEESKTGALWVGTLGGLSRLEGGRWTSFGIAHGLPHPAIGCLLETHDKAGKSQLWVGTHGGGLACLQGGRWRTYSMRSGLPSDAILALSTTEEAGETVLWVGFRGGGLGRLREGIWKFWGRGSGLPNNVVSSIHVSRRPDGSRELWIGTGGGGVAWSSLEGAEPAWQTLNKSSVPALPNDVVHQIQEDQKGRLYLSTNRGVARLTRIGEGFKLDGFTEEDGLPADQSSPTASLVDSRGHVWIGTVLGLGELDPGLPIPEEASRPLLFRGVLVQGKSGILPRKGESLVLGPDERDLAIDFGLLSYRKEGTQRFRTLLTGHDSGPSPWGSQRRREFTNLSPGSYVFHAWGKDWTGQESGPIKLLIVVRPALWETWGFRGLLLVLLVMGLYLTVRWRMGAVVRRADWLRRLVQRQTRELETANAQLRSEIEERIVAEKAKDEFVSIVSHELRTPITSIRGALGLLEGGVAGELQGEVGRMVSLAHGNVIRLQTLVNDLLDVQKLGSGNVRLKLEAAPLAALVRKVLAANEGFAKASGVNFILLGQPDGASVLMDSGRIEQVLANLLSNAAKFSPPGRSIEVRVHPGSEQGLVRVSVTNFGPPIPESFHERIFSKFAQADSTPSRSTGGTGLGLAISRILVDLHGGRIDFQSEAASTTFWFELPRAGCEGGS